MVLFLSPSPTLTFFDLLPLSTCFTPHCRQQRRCCLARSNLFCRFGSCLELAIWQEQKKLIGGLSPNETALKLTGLINGNKQNPSGPLLREHYSDRAFDTMMNSRSGETICAYLNPCRRGEDCGLAGRDGDKKREKRERGPKISWEKLQIHQLYSSPFSMTPLPN